MKAKGLSILDKDKEPTLKEEMDRWLRLIDAEFTHANIEIPKRPLLAAIQFVDLAVTAVDASAGGPVVPPKGAAMVTEPWFRVIFQHSETWYEARYGVRAKSPERALRGGVLVMGVPTLLKVPGASSKVDVPGETIWLSFPPRVQNDEDPIGWLVDSPNLAMAEPAEARRARKLAYETANALRSINCRLLGVPHDDPEKIELLGGVLPGLERAAELLVEGGNQSLKAAHWEIQMALERVLKAIAQERHKSYEQTHDLFSLYDRAPSPALPFTRDQLKKIPTWPTMAELRYGRGPTPTIEQTFTVYRTALKVIAAALQAFAGMDLSQAQVKLQKPPWMRPIDEVFSRHKPASDP